MRISDWSSDVCSSDLLADLGALQDRRIIALKLPGAEERRPVDAVDEFAERIIVESPQAEEARPRRRHRRPVDAMPRCPGPGYVVLAAVALAAGMACAERLEIGRAHV